MGYKGVPDQTRNMTAAAQRIQAVSVRRMGRSFKDAAVVKAYDAQGEFVYEDIVPSESFATSGSLLLNVASVRAARGIRFISFRLFDDAGTRVEVTSMSYDLAGQEVRANYRRPDGTIIENADWM